MGNLRLDVFPIRERSSGVPQTAEMDLSREVTRNIANVAYQNRLPRLTGDRRPIEQTCNDLRLLTIALARHRLRLRANSYFIERSKSPSPETKIPLSRERHPIRIDRPDHPARMKTFVRGIRSNINAQPEKLSRLPNAEFIRL